MSDKNKKTDTSGAEAWVKYSKSKRNSDAGDDEKAIQALKKYQTNPPSRMSGYNTGSEKALRSEYRNKDVKNTETAGTISQKNNPKFDGVISSLFSKEKDINDARSYGKAWADSTNADRSVQEMISAAQAKGLNLKKK